MVGGRAAVGYVGDDEQGRRVYQLSQSWLGTAGMCLEQARMSMEDTLPPSDSDATVRGTAVHAGIEYLLHCKQGGEPLSYEIAIEVAARSVEQDLEAMPHIRWTKYDGPHELHKMLNHVDVMLATWLEKIEPRVEPHLIEHQFDVVLTEDESYVVRLTGTIDCVEYDGDVVDWKTSDSAYTTRDAWKLQRYAVQPTAYAYARYAESGTIPDQFRYVCLRPNGKYDIIPIHRHASDFEALRHQVDQLVDMMDARLPHWPLGPTDWWCSPKWCSAWDDCRGKYVEEGWDRTIKV